MSDQTMSGHGPLGQQTEYRDQYDPDLLFPIPRAENRASLGLPAEGPLPFFGVDLWTGYEVSWLNERGKPEVALARFRIPCDSPNLVESKSFKLYLNSYNQTRMPGLKAVREQIVADLGRATGGTVTVEMESITRARQPVTEPAGECIDDLPVTINRYTPAPECLSSEGDVVEETLHSHLLKSNCPVTGQPDWASVEVCYRGPRMDRAGLLRYIVSFREHQDFHEHCVERMFLDIQERCRPERLTVYARYTRRGGLDINPFRSSEPGEGPVFERLVRQ